VGRYQEVVYSIAVLAASYLLFKVLNCSSPALVAALTPIVALAHEAVHLLTIRLLGLRHRVAVRGMKVGFVIDFDNPKKYIVCALSPQVITAMLAILSIHTPELAVLALIHVAMSVHDIAKSLKYARMLSNL